MGEMNRITELLGIEYPVLAFSHCRDVVAAVSRAGGLGVLGVVGMTPDHLDIELDWIENEVKGKPYGVDVLVPAKYVGQEEGGLDRGALEQLIPNEHRAYVDTILEKYGVDPLPEDEPRASGLLSWSHKGAAPLIDIALAKPGVRLMANALGPAPAELVSAAHERDVAVAGLVGNRVHAERQRNAGVDIVVAQGYEAGGHTGEIATMVLVPEVVDAVAPTPVLAAGGIASGRQMAAAMALGAEGVWTGSVWLTTEEAETTPVVKEKFLAATSSDTVRSRASTGKPARQLRTAWTEAWDDPAGPGALQLPLHMMLTAEAQQRIARGAAAGHDGAKQLATYFVGQVVGSEAMSKVRPARSVLMDMVSEYVDVVEKLGADLGA
jgi:NAD(P)H-dependent flavin oxidoreductase YrpB (nitropropane dioxygenase family)